MYFSPFSFVKFKSFAYIFTLLLSSVSCHAMQIPDGPSSTLLTGNLCYDLTTNTYPHPKLVLADHPIADINPLIHIFTYNTTVQLLDLKNTSLNSNSVAAFLDSLHSNTSIKTLILSHNTLGDECNHAIFRLLIKNFTLTHLDFSFNNFTEATANKLVDAFPTNTSIVQLNLEGNKDIKGDVLKKLAQLVKQNASEPPKPKKWWKGLGDKFGKTKKITVTPLEQGILTLSSDLLEPKGHTAALKAENLIRISLIKDFSSYRSTLGDEKFVKQVVSTCRLFNGLPTPLKHRLPIEMLLNLSFSVPHLDKLAITYGNFTLKAEGIKALGTVLSSNQVLRELSLQGQEIGSEGIDNLVQNLKNNTSLEGLRLRENKLGGNGVMLRFVPLISHNRSLKMLDLASNGFTDINDIQFFEVIFKQGCSLTVLCLDDNLIQDRGIQLLAKGLSSPNNLTELYLANNQISDEGAIALATLIASGSNLKILDLSKNRIKDGGAIALAEALPKSSLFEKLYLNKNMVGMLGLQAFTEWVLQKVNIKLSLGGNNFDIEAIGEAGSKAYQAQEILGKDKEIDETGSESEASTSEHLNLEEKEEATLAIDANELIRTFEEGKGEIYGSIKNLTIVGSLGSMDNPESEAEIDDITHTYGLQILAQALKPDGYLGKLQSLNLSSNNIDAQGLEVLSEGIQANTSLTSLNLDYNPIFDFLAPNTIGLYSLASAVKDKPILLENLSIQALKMKVKYEDLVVKMALKLGEK